ncbi:hypothetical protein GPAL_0708 [Glaciecola pallidula DSM 14239 = ACAM 615]|uniref:Uncharacterized protein n=1 Tax=Brumicola pallidula DSM 14239 = ACAM 615 TaxID=1121922 RepID=K6ZF92_9ALTE|nr:hypothetical protein GPAL_0708 [Glaciecola pallidula DSM 14239 = ACAM 615]
MIKSNRIVFDASLGSIVSKDYYSPRKRVKRLVIFGTF